MWSAQSGGNKKRKSEERELYLSQESCVKGHLNLLQVFDHIKPTFREYSFGALDDIRILVDLADMYGCTKLIGVHIDSHILINHSLQRRLMIDPVSFLHTSLTLKSGWMFKEVATRLVCANEDDWTWGIKRIDSPDMVQWLAKKRVEFKGELKDLNLNLLSIRSDGDDGMLAAITFFQHWFTQSPSSQLCLEFEYAKAYQEIPSLLKKAPLKEFESFLSRANLFDLSKDDRERSLFKVFEIVAELVDPFLKGTTTLPGRSHLEGEDLTYLEIRDDELPWNSCKGVNPFLSGVQMGAGVKTDSNGKDAKKARTR